MASKKITQLPNLNGNQVSTDLVTAVDLSQPAATQNVKSTLNDLFSVITKNLTDGALRFQGFAAPAVSTAGTGAIYFDSASNTFQISTNASAFAAMGTVTSVSVVTANGISGTVANSTTTPAITLTLGAITPSSVNGLTLTAGATGWTIAGGTSSKTLTLSNTLTLAGTDGSTINIGTGGTLGTAAFTAATAYAAAGAVTSSGLTMTTARLLGRSTASTGAIEEITVGSGLTLSGGTLTASGGSGTVTSVSVVTANGISGTVANSTTTPAITLTLGAITPSSVNGLTLTAGATGWTIAGGTSSKTLTLSNTLTLAGTDGSTINIGTGGTLGTAAFTAATAYAAAGAVTSSGLTMTTARLLGRSTASTGAIEEITVGSGLTLSGGTLTASGGSGTVTSVSVVTANGISGTVANSTTTPAITLTLGAITPSSVNGLTLTAGATGWTIAGGTSSKTLTLSNTLTLAGTDSSTLDIGTGGTLGTAAFTAATAYAAAGAVTSSGLTMTTARLLGRSTASTGAIEEITVGSGLTLSGGTLTASGGGGSPGGSSGQVQFYVNSTTFGGAAGFTYQSGASPNVTITAQNSAYVPLIVNGASGATANLFQVAVNNTVYAAVNSSGNLFLGRGEQSASPSSGVVSATNGSGTNIAGAALLLNGGAAQVTIWADQSRFTRHRQADRVQRKIPLLCMASWTRTATGFLVIRQVC
jgi:hypothetical protein